MGWLVASTNSTQVSDRREIERFRCHADVCGHLAVPGKGRVYLSSISNISQCGVGMIVPHRVEPGTVIALSLQDLARGLFHSALTRVIAAAEAAAGSWILHCAFARPLPPDLLQALVDES